VKPQDFKRWRKSQGLSQKDAAHALGLKRRVVQYYEKGERDGKKIDIPLYIRLACAAFAAGARDYHGPKKDMETRPEEAQIELGPADAAPETAPEAPEAPSAGAATPPPPVSEPVPEGRDN
jgi:transcriptional regulator with XRE-family HTH domain